MFIFKTMNNLSDHTLCKFFKTQVLLLDISLFGRDERAGTARILGVGKFKYWLDPKFE